MPSLWFIVPVHGRLPLASICLKQLARTCDQLAEQGIDATACIVGDLENLAELRKRTGGLVGLPGDPGRFASYVRDNQFTSRKFNDGIQAALDQKFNQRPADYVVPCGSDDWVHPGLFTDLPDAVSVFGFQRISFVREDGSELTVRDLRYDGGSGIRIFPRKVMERLGFRPADEDRKRGCDTSILRNLQHASHQAQKHLRIVHRDVDPRFIVDWKSRSQQLNSYRDVSQHRALETGDPWEMLDGVYPADALREMRGYYRMTVPRKLVAA
jgi:hypothetical protein